MRLYEDNGFSRYNTVQQQQSYVELSPCGSFCTEWCIVLPRNIEFKRNRNMEFNRNSTHQRRPDNNNRSGRPNSAKMCKEERSRKGEIKWTESADQAHLASSLLFPLPPTYPHSISIDIKDQHQNQHQHHDQDQERNGSCFKQTRRDSGGGSPYGSMILSRGGVA